MQLQPVLPSVPTKEIPKGNYSECNTLVSITVRLSSPLPSPSPEQLKLAVIILLQFVLSVTYPQLILIQIEMIILNLRKKCTKSLKATFQLHSNQKHPWCLNNKY